MKYDKQAINQERVLLWIDSQFLLSAYGIVRFVVKGQCNATAAGTGLSYFHILRIPIFQVHLN